MKQCVFREVLVFVSTFIHPCRVFPEQHLEAEKLNKCFNVPTKDMTTERLLKRKHRMYKLQD